MTRARTSVLQFVDAWLVMVAALVLATSAAAAEGPLANRFILRGNPKLLQSIQFMDGKGHARQLSDFRGKTILLNIWATWCVPCRKEMPALDRLQVALGGPDFEVVPLSIDRGGPDVVRQFYKSVGIQKLRMYLDVSGDATRKLAVVGLPTTLLLDREGRETARLIGPADWDTPDNVEFLRCIFNNVPVEPMKASKVA